MAALPFTTIPREPYTAHKVQGKSYFCNICPCANNIVYYPTLLPRVQISRETSKNNRYLYSSHSSRPREVQNLGKSEFWEKKSLDNKSLIRRFGV